jgi:hypothetical protein
VKAGSRRIVLPSAAWRRWAREAPLTWQQAFYAPPIRDAVNCRALFYRDANRGDAVGFYQGLADLLEQRAVIANDRLIVSWDGSRLLKDAAEPRVEVVLEAVS